MAEFEFEGRLSRLFHEEPSFDDAAAFAAGVQSKLNRKWATRNLVIGALGGAGGMIAVGQIINSGVLARLNALSHGSTHLAWLDPGRWSIGHGLIDHPGGPMTLLAVGGMWLVLGGIGFGAALLVTRLIEDL